MDVSRIGLVIKTLRKKAGLTQQQLAEKVGVTDKAVSKWERGAGSPDISTINQLSNILNIDTDNLLAGNIAYLENEWVGELRLDKFKTKISITTEVYGKPSVYFYLCYFALVGINDIYICCSDSERDFLIKLVGTGKKYGLTLHYGEPDSKKRKMVIEGAIFLYGPNLTKYFQRGMSHENAQTRLIIPHGNKNTIYLNGKNQVSDVSLTPQGYHILPIFFENNSENIEYEPLGKGMTAIEFHDMNDVLAVSNLLQILSKYSGEEIYCLDEIAFKRGLIDLKQLKKNADRNEYLVHLSKKM